MINVILDLLEVAKKNKQSGRYISIALGKNKFPDSIKETKKLLSRKLWKDAQ